MLTPTANKILPPETGVARPVSITFRKTTLDNGGHKEWQLPLRLPLEPGGRKITHRDTARS